MCSQTTAITDSSFSAAIVSDYLCTPTHRASLQHVPLVEQVRVCACSCQLPHGVSMQLARDGYVTASELQAQVKSL